MQTFMPESDETKQIKPKHPGGRPSKFNTRTIRKAREYIKGEIDVVPTVAGLCVHLGIARKTIYQWLKDNINQEFSNTMALMPEVRERRLINGALKGDYNSNIAKLILTTNHGYSENNQKDTGITVNVNRSAAVTTGNDGKTLTIDVED